uniref:Phycocyanin alpha phycocyanobilin lyase; CpcE n=1 Tax=Paulinella chromatophora TaxID=39717 RepID=B1X532_PAUCH|nr:phycocyanin alpha phycocyanobilin lyase; CpcE [Paulinella chromatophora]ACB43051.1 phycocyanin alpha phycocyanobilin lyase; CpcE [Paulinella chromatophora]
MNERLNSQVNIPVEFFATKNNGESIGEAEALEWLKQSDTSMQYYAAWWLGRNRSTHPETIPLLCKALKQRQPRSIEKGVEANAVARNAARALGKLKDPTVIPSLLKALEDNDDGLREATSRALGEIKAKEAIFPLIKKLSSGPDIAGSPQEGSPRLKEPCEAMIEALGNIGYPSTEAIAVIKPFCNHDRPLIRSATYRALLQLTGEYMWADTLIDLLKHKQIQVRRAVMMDLGAVGWRPALEPIVQTLAENSLKLIALRGLVENTPTNYPQEPSIVKVMAAMDELI